MDWEPTVVYAENLQHIQGHKECLNLHINTVHKGQKNIVHTRQTESANLQHNKVQNSGQHLQHKKVHNDGQTLHKHTVHKRRISFVHKGQLKPLKFQKQ